MKAVLYFSTNGREQELAHALVQGFAKHGVKCEAKTRSDFWADNIATDADIVGFVGVKSRKMFADCKAQGKVPLLIDKGYFGRGEYYRMSLGDYQPPYLKKINSDGARARKLIVGFKPTRRTGNAVMYVGSSQKYCNFHELGDNNDYARKIVTEIKEHWAGTIIYRPKPSWWAKTKAGERRDNLSDLGVEFSGPDVLFPKVLNRCYAIVTHGSNAAAESLVAGIPVVMTSPRGVSPVYDLCDHDIASLRLPRVPFIGKIDQRQHIISAMAHCQFTVEEMVNGYAWSQMMRFMPGPLLKAVLSS